MNLTTRSISEPSEARPAATLVVLRAGADRPEVLLTTRPASMRFMGGAVVFPGGAVADADLDSRWERASRLGSDDAAAALGLDDPRAALAAYVCALREAFEEVGFIAGDGPLHLLGRADADDAAAFLERCLELGVVLATDELVPGGRWVTPPTSPVRFDARFFLVAAAPGWEPDPDPGEVAECRWATPAAALEELAAGDVLMAPPTIEVLQRLAPARSVAEALAVPAPRDDAPLSVRLAPFVHLVLAPNPGLMTGPGTNTYVVGSDPFVVVDPAVADDVYIDAVVAASQGRVAAIVVTHRHDDHAGGAAALRARTGAPVRAFGDAPAGGAPVEPLGDGDVVRAGEVALRALHTPGHSSDHLCLLIDGASDLFSGDTLVGEGTAVIAPPDGDMRAYLESLRRLAALDLGHVYPGHYRPRREGAALVRDYLRHREERAGAIVAAVADGAGTVSEIVGRVYRDTPADLHPVAAFSVLAHLEMAEEEGLVRRAGSDRWTRP